MDDFSVDFDDVDCVVEVTSSTIKRKSTSRDDVPDEIKKKIIESLENGSCDRKAAATIFNVPYKKVCRIYYRFLKTGVIEKRKKAPESPKRLSKEIIQFLFDALAENCTYTNFELQEMVNNKYGEYIDSLTLSKEVGTAFHYNLKRIHKVIPSVVRPSRAKERQSYCESFLGLLNSKRILIYLDETEFKVIVRPKRVLVTPAVKTKTKSILASMTQNHIVHYKAFDGSVTRARKLEFLYGLFDELSAMTITKAVIIMNKSCHNYWEEITTVIEESGHDVVLLPENSSFFNPVEKMFSQWDMLVRSLNPGSDTELDDSIESLASTISGRQCQNYWDHAMYNVTSCINGKLICIS